MSENSENIEKYRQLHDFISTPSKAELFGLNGLFGSLRQDHSVLELFTEYLDALKKAYKHLPNIISGSHFIAYLHAKKSTGEDDNLDLIKKINSLRQRGIIVDEPPAKNTFYNFALILDNLNIFDRQELTVNNYNEALEKAIQLHGLIAPGVPMFGQQPAAESGKSTGETAGLQAGATEDGAARTPDIQTGSSPTENNSSVGSGSAEVDSTSTREADLKVNAEQEEKEEITAKTAAKKNDERNIAKGEIKPVDAEKTDNKPAGDRNLSSNDSPGKSELDMIGSTAEEYGILGKSELEAEPMQDKDGISSEIGGNFTNFPDVSEAMLAIPREIPQTGSQHMPQSISQIQRSPQRKRIHRFKHPEGILRKPTNEPHRLKDMPGSGQKSPASDRPQTQTAEQAAEMDSRTRRPSTSKKGVGAQRQANKGSMATKLAKAGIIGTLAGTAVPVFAGKTAEAAALFNLFS